jgi:outer membrane murein-binding lipoprotein Lpp
MSSPRALLVVAVLGSLALAGCKKSKKLDEAAPESGEAAVAEPTAAVAPAAPASPAEADRNEQAKSQPETVPGASPARPRKIIRTGSLLLEVEDHDRTRAAIDDLVRGAGGFVAAVEVGRDAGAAGSATLTLRLPEARLDSALAKLAKLGTLRRESLRAEDVSETYYDLAARLRNAKRLEERMLELAARAAGVKDLLEVEREVGRVRESIEVMEGQMRVLDDRTQLATLTVELVTRRVYVPEDEAGLAARIGEAFDVSVQGLVATAEGLLLFLVAALPWLLPIGVVGLLVRRRLRRRV